MYTRIFELKEEHLKLLDRSSVSWNDIEYGAASLEPKYPYGSHDVYGDMGEVLGLFPMNEEDGYFSEEDEKHMDEWHTEMKTVLEIGIHTRLFSKGFYVKEDYAGKWKTISEDRYHELAQLQKTR